MMFLIFYDSFYGGTLSFRQIILPQKSFQISNIETNPVICQEVCLRGRNSRL